MKGLKAKLHAHHGMTLTEVLAALLILALVTAGTAAGVSASLQIYRRSVILSDAQTLSSTLSIALMDELRYARDPDPLTGDFTSATFGEKVSVGDDGEHITIGDNGLIGEGSYAGLTAKPYVKYSDGYFNVSLTISLDNEQLQTVEFMVRPLNS